MNKEKEDSTEINEEKVPSTNLFRVVGVGASAGGLEAFKRFLKAIPENSGMAFILVQHLDPAHDSILTDLLQRVTKIPVEEITDNVYVVPDHIYIIPSNKLLTATDGILQLSPRPHGKQKNMPIDIFFSSLAEVHQDQAIGIVLSGTGSDGTLGLKAIKDHGGITFAQQPPSAAYEAMPQNAIDTGVIDHILPPEKMAEQLVALNNTFEDQTDSDGKDTGGMTEDAFRQVLSLLRDRKGVDFTYYKQTTIRRRINRRIALSMMTSVADYLAFLVSNRSEQDILYQDLLIPVTQFFRDPRVFEILCENVFPALLKDKPWNEPLRIWVAGCSTGEEAYSIVMCLHEHLGDKALNSKIQLFATDISEIAIAKARSGIYKKSEVGGLSTSRLSQFFTSVGGNFHVNKSIRESCIFASHNFLKDPPFAKIDLITCRNVLIYMEPVLQKKAAITFHYALKENGFLVLGRSEAATQAADMYHVFDKNNKIYTRKAVPGKFMHLVADHKEGFIKESNYGIKRKEKNKDDFQTNADDVLLSKYAPPGVIVNNDLDIVQFRGATGMWLEQSSGRPDLNLLKMAREGLSFELRNALHKVKNSKEAFVKADIPVQFMDRELLVTLDVIPLLNTSEPHFLVLFRDVSLPFDPAVEAATRLAAVQDSRQSREQARILELQRELAVVREDMRSITEDQETANQELQSSNEELLSGSEELQSLNEELETSREEIQTSNEELIIVNQELYDRNEQLERSREYAESIVTTIREPLIVLNKDLVITSANRAFYEKFQTSAGQTEGKVLFAIGNDQWNIPALRKLLEHLLPEKASIVDYEVTHDLPGMGQRVMLLNATCFFSDNSDTRSILLAIEDITERVRTAKTLQLFSDELEKQVVDRTFSLHEANADLRNSNDNLAQFAYIASHDLQEPLRKILMFSSLIQERYAAEFPEKAQELTKKIISSAERMSLLIKEVLDFSKILHSDIALEKADLDRILTDVLNDFDLLISEKQAVIYRDELPVIDAIPVQVKQLFYNLMSNALKFSRKDVPPVITIVARNMPQEEVQQHPTLDQAFSYCEICFSDNGVGFRQQYADKIFLIFHRLHSGEQFAGTGIGLALCKKIVDNHHGEIYATSDGEGAMFHIILPLTQ